MMIIRNILHRALSKLLHIIYGICGRALSSQGRVLMIHSVGDERHEFNISIESFERLLKSISSNNIVRLEEWERKRDFLCLTFDDVPDSFYHNAYPLLVQYGVPFTIFVSCSLLDTPLYISSDMLKEIASCPLCTLGSHGNKHIFFRDFNKEEALNDLLSSKNYLERIAGKEVNLFAFPYGSIYACGLRNKRIVSNCYKYGFGTIASPITKPLTLPKYYLPRINVSEKMLSDL